MRASLPALAAALVSAATFAQPAPPAPVAVAQAANARQCGICHGRPEFKKVEADGTVRSLFVDESVLKASVHAKWQCTDCHADVTKIPHQAPLAQVNCQRCHYAGNQVGAPEQVNYEGYVKSVHGRLRLAGNLKAPICQDCHGTHNIRKHTDPTSTVNKENVPETCGRCHVDIFARYRQSIHGVQLLVKHNLDAPSCIDCHGEHSILSPKEKGSEVSATNIPETCAHCHGSMAFNTKFDIPINPVSTFKHTFHGIANELGSKRVANCASCHTAHDVLPPEDPRSSVNPANIPKTCGHEGCHVGANINYARGRFHVDPASRSAGIIYWVALFFKILTISTMVGLVIHILLDLVKKLRQRHAEGHTGE
jgi:hypothetical protein